jgi:hypothetical protein
VQDIFASLVPHNAVCIVRSASASATLYTVPAGKTLVLVSASVSIAQANTTPAHADMRITVPSEDDASSQTLVRASVGDNAGQSNAAAMSNTFVRVKGGSTVACTLSGTPDSAYASFVGWLRPV